MVWVTYLDGNSFDEAWGVALDSSGNVYVTGYSASTDFPRMGGLGLGLQGLVDGFVTKLTSSSGVMTRSTYVGYPSTIGSTGVDYLFAIAVDGSGNVYVTGSYSAATFVTTTDFPCGMPAIGGTWNFGQLWVAKLDTTLATLVYSVVIGGSTALDSLGTGIAVDADRNAYVAGNTKSSTFAMTPGALQTSFGGGDRDAVVVKLNAAGDTVLYSTYLGGETSDFAIGIALDTARNAPVTQAPIQAALGGDWDGFVVKLDPTGLILRYSTFLGGRGQDVALGIALDSSGNAYITGATSDRRSLGTFIVANFPNFPAGSGLTLPPTACPVPPCVQTSYGGGTHDAFIAKISDPGVPLHFVSFPATFPALPTTGKVGVPYIGNVGIGGGVPAPGPEGYDVVVAQGALPTGLRLGSGANASGTPASIQTALFRVQVTDQLGTIVDQFDRSISIQAPSVPIPEAGTLNVSPGQPLAWPTVANATAYRLMVAESAGALPTSASSDTCPACVLNVVVASPFFSPLPGTLLPGRTYHWQFKPIVGGNSRAWSSVRSFTTRARRFVFSADPLAVTTTVVSASHIMELRTVINERRVHFGLNPFGFGQDVVAGTAIQLHHLIHLRSALSEIFALLGRPLPISEPTVAARETSIKAAHLNELRVAVEWLD